METWTGALSETCHTPRDMKGGSRGPIKRQSEDTLPLPATDTCLHVILYASGLGAPAYLHLRLSYFCRVAMAGWWFGRLARSWSWRLSPPVRSVYRSQRHNGLTAQHVKEGKGR